jgi:hypothetical protein
MVEVTGLPALVARGRVRSFLCWFGLKVCKAVLTRRLSTALFAYLTLRH